MNRLILIGNGFDLAHNLNTSYNSFLLGHLKHSFSGLQPTKSYQSGLFDIGIPIHGRGFDFDSLIDHCYKENTLADLLENKVRIKGFAYPRDVYTVSLKSSFWLHLAKQCSLATWVEIENEYYSQLKNIISPPMHRSGKGESIKKLNDSMGEITSALEAYLYRLPKPLRTDKYSDLFSQSINLEEIPEMSAVGGTIEPSRTLILNFNYTSTPEIYLDNIRNSGNFSINYIHGELQKPSNPIVFGFGDEVDSHYKNIENSGINGCFDHLKSFWYTRTKNYHDLIKFIGQDAYQVFTLGHSCGLSDRTMLKMIFEHKNCAAIKIFYHGNTTKNNFKRLTEDISKHFDSKAQMREKITPFPYCESMPQANQVN
ncbi:AbiH family protein [Chitinophaga ginsengisoli]|uniref:Abortive infection AbiH-like protein n=1 Tax=Chitinophaga ginsengisoli TaxID=363837 RepID=A0A2P8FXJ0_9BACT|nr:AbiH family protein [Chitinophaga ginsengisoli]PSL26437.1 abortive infection AbiH-like protein [Chitinophaga ginsengisoli]